MATIAGGRLGGVSRRHFLAGMSSIAAATYVLGPNGSVELDPAGALGSLVDGVKRRLSVGYVMGSADKGRDALEGGARVVPASSLRRGDASLRGTTAEVKVHGLSPGHDVAAVPSVHVDALFPSTLDSTTLLPFYAWTLSSSPAAFSVLLERTPRLGFAVTAAGAGAAAAFTTGAHEGMTPLHEGLYLLGLEPAAWDRPRTLPAIDDGVSWSGLVSALVSVHSPTPEPSSYEL